MVQARAQGAAEVSVQQEDFDVGAEIARLGEGRRDVGAVASFVGLVRDANDGSGVRAMTLEHYPGMTERALGRHRGAGEGALVAARRCASSTATAAWSPPIASSSSAWRAPTAARPSPPASSSWTT